MRPMEFRNGPDGGTVRQFTEGLQDKVPVRSVPLRRVIARIELSRERFPGEGEAVRWARDHGFATGDAAPTAAAWVFRQHTLLGRERQVAVDVGVTAIVVNDVLTDAELLDLMGEGREGA